MKRAALLLGMLSLSGLWTGAASAQYLETIRIRAIYADPRDYVVETDRREVVSLGRNRLIPAATRRSAAVAHQK